MSTGFICSSQSLFSLCHESANEEKFPECSLEGGRGKAYPPSPFPSAALLSDSLWVEIGFFVCPEELDGMDNMKWQAVSSCGRLDGKSLQDSCTVSQEMEITGREDRSYASEFTQTASVLRWCLRQLGHYHSWQTPTGQFGMLGELNFLSLSKGFRPSKITEGSEESSNTHCGYQQSQVQKITNIYLILVQYAKQNNRIRKSSDAKEPKLQTPRS